MVAVRLPLGWFADVGRRGAGGLRHDAHDDEVVGTFESTARLLDCELPGLADIEPDQPAVMPKGMCSWPSRVRADLDHPPKSLVG